MKFLFFVLLDMFSPYENKVAVQQSINYKENNKLAHYTLLWILFENCGLWRLVGRTAVSSVSYYYGILFFCLIVDFRFVLMGFWHF